MSRKLFALFYGLLSHLLFGLAVYCMIRGLFDGMNSGHGPFVGLWAFIANGLLLLSFPLIHSFLLAKSGRRYLSLFFGKDFGGTLSTTTFSLIASLQILIVFYCWSPTHLTWTQPSGRMLAIWSVVYAGTWLFLVKSMIDSGLGVQLGYLGWTAAARGEKPKYGRFASHGLFRFIRHPVYLAFATTLWAGPTWSADHLFIALVWTVYCVVGPLLKERRYLDFYGKEFADYMERVPYMVPTAASLLPEPGFSSNVPAK